MKRPAIFFDRDNTLIACDGYLGDPSKVTLIPGAADAVARARRLGYATVIFSNQSGVARGYFNEEAVHDVNARVDELLLEGNDNAVIDRHEFCPFHPDGTVEKYAQESPLRKPHPGMLHSAAEALALDLSRSWVIGDAPRDIEAGHAAGCRTILYVDPSLPTSIAARDERKVEPDLVCATLSEAMDFVEDQTEAPPAGTLPVSPPPPQKKTGETSLAPTERMERTLTEILQELRRRHEQPQQDFSVSKLMAGIVQVLVLAMLFVAFLNRADVSTLNSLMLFALTLQTLTIALLIMGRQR